MASYTFLGEPPANIKEWIEKTYFTIYKVQTTSSYKKTGIYSAQRDDASKPVKINWGDGTTEIVDSDVSQLVHEYSSEGEFTVKVSNIKTFAASANNTTWYNTSQNIYTLKELVNLNKAVTSIRYGAFYSCSGLTSVTIPDSVTSIGDDAFYGCSGLTAVYITDITKWCNITFDETYANPLYYAHNLYLNGMKVTDLVIPNDVTSIGQYAFEWCRDLTSATIPDSVTSIGKEAFYGCGGLKSVTIPNSVTSIGELAFCGCDMLVASTINKPCDTVASNALNWGLGIDGNGNPFLAVVYCSDGIVVLNDADSSSGGLSSNEKTIVRYTDGSIKVLNIKGKLRHSSIPNIENAVEVTVGDAVNTINGNAFENCSNLKHITISDNVTTINDAAFRGCDNLTAIKFPNRLQTISYELCSGCTSLTSVTIPDSVTCMFESAFFGCNDSLFDTTTISGMKLVDGWAVGNTGSLSGNLNLTGVRGIAKSAFSYCSGLTSVTIPNSAVSIGDYAFSGCSGLTSVTIGNGVTSIGGSAFSGCSGLTSVTIPNSVTSIESSAFSGCSRLTSVTIPDSVTSIGYHAFEWCSDSLYDTTTIPGVKLVDGWAVGYTDFSGNLNLTGIRGIGGGAFCDCSGLTSVTIPDSVPSIGGLAFQNCSGLMSVKIPGSVTSIGEQAFYGCSGLTGLLTIPDSVTSIGYWAFHGCSGLTFVAFDSKDKATVQRMDNYSWELPSGCVIHCIDDDITL